ncbi:RNA polymerase sigma factor SigD [Corynebacterium kutscheri]|uniref:RNA polymerase sigma factor SigD n=1 Tax=Corynebacterium kutscheri TaxID=35755 RepID=A0A0F6QZB9_9CORY|nr:sigma-70 family RNA polymerase sigma factor [Corynebacterium kutscheri]AKE40630.1 RNA polymerase sigma factor, sigma-70 family [Corynebacterium kutscheri]VEH04817.1 RNA polymerase sigma factor SigD [Corynebacterium kutscheri]VEH11027.1 RNA polymerase sigma factor SigD [Corynebacterium kutscheri]VEH80494.1 RNA polymerase sigma factor SigD [Corynebacterium kutscheri]
MTEQEKELAGLVPAAAAGDRRALQRIIEIIHPAVLRYVRARVSTGKHPTAEDIVQEICLAVATSITNFVDQGRPFMAFVYGIASNKVTDAHRSFARDKTNLTDEVPDVEITRDTPEEFALIGEGSNKVRTLLDSLNEKPREILILRIFAGFSAEETAEIVGSSPGAVRVAQHRALSQLRKLVEQEREQ